MQLLSVKLLALFGTACAAAGGFFVFGHDGGAGLPWSGPLQPIGSNYYTDGAKIYYDRRMCDSARSCTPPPPQEVPGADPASFEVLSKGDWRDSWAKDRGSVYRAWRPVPQFDAATFVLIDSGPYVRDRRGVYFDGAWNFMREADPGTFATVAWCRRNFARDREHVYDSGEIRTDLDASTFRCLSSEWSLDAAKVLYEGAVVEGADPASFEAIPYPDETRIPSVMYARDARSVFCRTQRIEEADPATFRIAADSSETRGNNMVQEWEDAGAVYRCTVRVAKNPR